MRKILRANRASAQAGLQNSESAFSLLQCLQVSGQGHCRQSEASGWAQKWMLWKQGDICFLIISSWLLKMNLFQWHRARKNRNVLSCSNGGKSCLCSTLTFMLIRIHSFSVFIIHLSLAPLCSPNYRHH